MKLEIIDYPFSEEDEALLKSLEEHIFGSIREKKWFKLQDYSDVWATVARDDQRIVSMKIGFKTNSYTYYSWVGGTHKSFRGKGLATKLMDLQHEECLKRGYKVVQTKTYNRWKEMLILNLKNGFDIFNAARRGNGDSKILLQKRLK